MGCLFDCFRAAGGEPRAGRARAQLVSSSVIPAAYPKVGERRAAPPSRNALSAVFLREDEGSQATSSGTNQDARRKSVDRELRQHEATFLQNDGALLENLNEIRKDPENTDSVYQSAAHSALLPPLSENFNFMDVLKAEDCQTPPESHQSSYLPDATSSSWKECDSSDLHESESVSKTEDSNGVNNESVIDCEVNAEVHTPATNAPNLQGLGNENSSQHLSEALNPVGDFQNCENSEGSVSSCNKINAFEEKCQSTEVTVRASRKKVITNRGSDVEFPSLSEWLKPPNSRSSDTAKSSDDDRPIIGMVAAHWKSEEPEVFTPQWWDGNGIPNSTNKYKEDQKVSWHAMSFEERLEKALSEEKLLSQRKCSTGNTSQFSGVEGEESDTAASNHLRVAAFT
ncbi:unnamed protein product [Alopecurus aequalis]